MKKVILLFVFIIGLFIRINVCYADNIYKIENPNKICDGVKNDTIKIYRYTSIDESNSEQIVKASSTSCKSKYKYTGISNDNYYRQSSYTSFKIENTSLDSTYYKFFAISNESEPEDKVFFDIELPNIGIDSSYKDLRFTMNYGWAEAKRDINIVGANSISYYVYTSDNNYYGPYKLQYYNLEDTHIAADSLHINRYSLISENLLKGNIDKSKIMGIRIVPYDTYNIKKGWLRLYDFSLDAYESFSIEKEYINIDDPLLVRHSIVNNMVNNATIKWDLKKNDNENFTLNFYNSFNTSSPIAYSTYDNQVQYGVPYLTSVDSTINSFISQTDKIDDTYSYKATKKYLESGTATNGDVIEKDSDISYTTDGNEKNYVLNVYEKGNEDNEEPRKTILSENNYVLNAPGYLYGMDCSSSTFSSIGSVVPFTYSMAKAERYFESAEVKLIGNMSLTFNEVERTVREQMLVDDSIILVDDNNYFSKTDFQHYYSSYIRNKYEKQRIYNAYSSLKPGDVIGIPGHVRMVTGYSHIVCNDNYSTDNYVDSVCDNHEGISDESYVVVSEINSPNPTTHSLDDIANDDNFKLTFDSKYTDINSLEEFSSKPSQFKINQKYSFSELYGNKDSESIVFTYNNLIYLPFEYLEYNNTDEGKIEKPSIRVLNGSTYEDIVEGIIKGNIITNYIIDGIKIVLDDTTIYQYPNITNSYSVYYDLPKDLLTKNSYGSYELYVKLGPDFQEVWDSMDADNEGYIKVLDVKSKADDENNGWHLVESEHTTIPDNCTGSGGSCSAYSSSFYTDTRTYDLAYLNNGTEEKRVTRMVCAHEGATGASEDHLYPYNTTLSYYMTRELGFNCNEIDVRFTSDNVPVVAHNAKYYVKDNKIYQNSVSGATQINISDITYDELKNYKVVSRYSNMIDENQIDQDCQTYLSDEYNKDNNYCKRIPTLKEMLELSDKYKMALSIEIKAGDESSIKKMVNLVNGTFNQESIRWLSTNDDYLNYVIDINKKSIIERVDISSDPLTNEEKQELYNTYKNKCNDCLVSMPKPYNQDYSDKYLAGYTTLDIGYNKPNIISCCLDVGSSCDIDTSISVEPSTIDFGDTYTDDSNRITRIVTIKNIGNVDVVLGINNPTSSGPFGSYAFDVGRILKPNEEYTASLIVRPSSPYHNIPGTYNGEYSIIAAYKDDPTIQSIVNVSAKVVVKAKPNISYTTHVQTYGWQKYVKNGEMAGTSGEAKRLEGIKIKLGNQEYTGDVEYRTHVQTYGWQDYVKNDEMSGTSGEAKRLEAIQIRLTGEMAEHYDIYYRVHAQTYGWLGWAKNDEIAGTSGLAKRLEGIEIQLVEKGGSPKENEHQNDNPAYYTIQVEYTTHVQTYGWQAYSHDGGMAGTSGEAKRLEGIRIHLSNQKYSGDIEYRTHVQTYGWQDYVKNDEMSGTSGEAKRLEAIQIRLTGEMADHYDIYYRVHAQSYGWLGWAKNDELAGTAGLAKRLEGIEIQLVEKGKSPKENEHQNDNLPFYEN